MDSDDVQSCQFFSNDLKRPEMTSNNLAKPNTKTESTVKRTSNKKTKNIPKAGSVHENFEINDEFFRWIFSE